MMNPTGIQKMRREVAPAPLARTVDGPGTAGALATAAPAHAIAVASFVTALLVALLATPAAAQQGRVLVRPDMQRIMVRSMDGPMIGVTTTAESERADTLGLRIESVEKGSPAEKAGLKEGDRLQSVNGLNLRAAPSDAGQEDYAGVLNRRLQREVQATKPGESIELRVLSGGSVHTVKVTPMKASEFMKTGAEAGGMVFRSASSDRAALGLTIASTGTVRDTLGIFVQAVTKDGPAEKAGIIEGDRIAAINGVSLKVAKEDVEDPMVGPSRVERLTSALEKLKAGDAVDLTVVTAGRARTVRVTTVKASDLPGGDQSTFIFRRPDGGAGMSLEGMRPLMLDGIDGENRLKIEQRLQELAPRLRELAPQLDRIQLRRSVRTIII
jgi:S1-C subfamily serine protease